MLFSTILFALVLTTFSIPAGPRCPEKDGDDAVYIPHSDCTKFWECSNGTPYLFNCPSKLHFNPKLNVCDWPDQAGCNSSGSGESSESSDSSSSSSSSESTED